MTSAGAPAASRTRPPGDPNAFETPAPDVRPPRRDGRPVVDRRGRSDRSGRRLRAVDPARWRPRTDRVLRPPRAHSPAGSGASFSRAPSLPRVPGTGRSWPRSTRGPSPATSGPGLDARRPDGRPGGRAARCPARRPTSSASGSMPTTRRSRRSPTIDRRILGFRRDEEHRWLAEPALGLAVSTPGARRRLRLSPDAAAVGRTVCRARGDRPAGPHRRRRGGGRCSRSRDGDVRRRADGAAGDRPPAGSRVSASTRS